MLQKNQNKKKLFFEIVFFYEKLKRFMGNYCGVNFILL